MSYPDLISQTSDSTQGYESIEQSKPFNKQKIVESIGREESKDAVKGIICGMIISIPIWVLIVFFVILLVKNLK